MEEVSHLVARAAAPDAALAERHRAFGRIVTRFQDMAFGCAYAVLGDRHLAEEAAQEAFIAAWQNLHRLQNPEAFPGWFRRIVLSRCGRLTRGKRAVTVPLDPSLPLPGDDPHSLAEEGERREMVRQAIGALPQKERVAVVLFYIGGYSRADIAAFVGASEVAVKKRLAAARKRLKERMLTMVQDDLHENRPSRDEAFALRVLAFTRQFSTMVDEGKSLVRCLTELARQQDDKLFQEAIGRINQDIQAGYSLSTAMARHPQFFDERYINAVRLGEYLGTLEVQLQRLAGGEAFDVDAEAGRIFTQEHPTITGIADRLINRAIHHNASEIRLTPDAKGVKACFIVEGALQEASVYPKFIEAPLFARYKAMANITGRSGSREGSIRFQGQDEKGYDLTASVRPADFGEEIRLTISSP